MTVSRSPMSLKVWASEPGSMRNVIPLRSAIPAAEGYYQSHAQTYTGMDNAALQAVAPGVAPHVLVAVLNTGTGYCLQDTESNGTFYYIGGVSTGSTGPVGTVSAGTCTANDGGHAAS